MKQAPAVIPYPVNYNRLRDHAVHICPRDKRRLSLQKSLLLAALVAVLLPATARAQQSPTIHWELVNTFRFIHDQETVNELREAYAGLPADNKTAAALERRALFLIAGLGGASAARYQGNVNGATNLTEQNNFVVTNARSQNAPKFLVKVLVPVKPTGISDPPQHFVDFLFPNLQEIAPNRTDSGLGVLVIYLELQSPQSALIGRLLGFRNNPHEIRSLGMAAPNPTGTETSLRMKGAARLVTLDKQSYLEATYEFPNPQVADKWLAAFPVNSKIFEAGFHVKPNLTTAEADRMKTFWRDLFETNGKLRIEVSGAKNFVLEYDIKKTSPAVVVEKDWVKVPYTIASPSKLVSGNF